MFCRNKQRVNDDRGVPNSNVGKDESIASWRLQLVINNTEIRCSPGKIFLMSYFVFITKMKRNVKIVWGI